MSGGYKGVYDRLAYDGLLVIAFTLDGPIITQISFRHQVYTKIFPAEILFPGNSSQSQTSCNLSA